MTQEGADSQSEDSPETYALSHDRELLVAAASLRTKGSRPVAPTRATCQRSEAPPCLLAAASRLIGWLHLCHG
jgi:hypothetical protein